MNSEEGLLDNVLEMILVDAVVVMERLTKLLRMKLRINPPRCSHQQHQEQDIAILSKTLV